MSRLGPRRDGRVVRAGVVWSGSAAHPNNEQRSIPVAMLKPLLEHPRLEAYSLQVGGGVGLGVPPERDWGVADLRETAAMMMALDLVITVDTRNVAAGSSLNDHQFQLPFDAPGPTDPEPPGHPIVEPEPHRVVQPFAAVIGGDEKGAVVDDVGVKAEA